jgi:hypothetical protein
MRRLQYSFDILILAFIVALPTPLFIAGLERCAKLESWAEGSQNSFKRLPYLTDFC